MFSNTFFVSFMVNGLNIGTQELEKKQFYVAFLIPKEYNIQNIFQLLWAIRLFVLFICASGCVCSLCKILILFPSHDMRFSLGIC